MKRSSRMRQNAGINKKTGMTLGRKLWRDRYMFLMVLPIVVLTIVFNYTTMFGIVIAFEDFDIFDGFFGSKWVGLENFRKAFTNRAMLGAIWNTLRYSLLSMAVGIPLPLILALLLNELTYGKFKKVTQTVSYLPHFLSYISVIGLVHNILGRDGIVNDVIASMGRERISFLSSQAGFIWLVLFIEIWKETGWGTVIHLSTLSSISPELYEVASIDGANRLQKLRYITIPHVIPTCVILLIFRMGALFGSNFELIYGLQNPFVDFEVISTITYKYGIAGGKYSLSTAFSLAQSVISLILVLITNRLSKKLTGNSII